MILVRQFPVPPDLLMTRGAITETTYFRRCVRRAGCTDWIGESNCIVKTVDASCNNPVCETRTISNTVTCGGQASAFYSDGLFTGITSSAHYTVQSGTFTEYTNGTAHLTASFVNGINANIILNVDVVLSGRTSTPPAGSPYFDACSNSYDTSDWYYYTDLSGTATGQDAVAGLVMTVTPAGSSFQVGTGANLREDVFGGSGWVDLVVVSQPDDTAITANENTTTDFNFSLSGGELVCPCDNVTDAGEIAGDETGCAPSYNPGPITSVALPSGGSGSLEYIWLSTTDGTLPVSQWDLIANATGSTYDPGAISETTYFIRCSRRSGCTAYVGESNVVTKTIDTCTGGGTGADLQLTQTAAQTTFSIYEHVLFTVTLTNNGPETATGITVKNVKPTGTNYGGDTPSQGTYSNWSGIWTVGDLAPNATAVLELDWFTMVNSGDIVNFAQVWTSDVDDPNSTPGNNTTNVATENDEAGITITASTNKAQVVDGIESNTLKLMPVPARDFVDAEFVHVGEGDSDIRIYDMTGKLLIEQQVYLPEGYNRVRIDTDMLPDGMYLMTILNGSEAVTAKFYKSK